MSRFSIEEIIAASDVIDSVFLHTPQYQCDTLNTALACNVILKIETLNPIRSFKGRGAEVLISKTMTDRLMCASAGNFGQAMAYACRKKGIRLTIYASEQANPFKVERMCALDADVILKGADFDASKQEAKAAAQQSGIRFIEDSLDVETIIGAGTIGLELDQYPGKIDAVLIALGNGALFNGVAKVIRTYRSETKIIAVQAEGAPAMIESWQSGKIICHEKMNTIADGIGVRIPVPQALEDMKGLVDDGLLVKDESILAAMRLIHEHAGIIVEPSGAVGIAAILENGAQFKNKTVATILCGGNLTHEQVQKWIC